MKNLLVKVFMVAIVMAMCSGTVCAQGFLKKLGKVTNVAGGQETDEAAPADSTSTDSKLKKDEIPMYTCQMVYETDEQGNRLKNEDGTDVYRVFLFDKNGNKVSGEAVEAQSKQINNAILRIAGKVGGGAALGAIGGAIGGGKKGAAKGALVGVAAGLGLSVNDLILCVSLKKSINKQKKCIEAYRKSFDEEGKPIDAAVDPTSIKDLNLTADNVVEETSAKIMADLESENYKSTPTNDTIDSLHEAATKA